MYFAQFDYKTEECFLCVVAEEIVIERDIKFYSENEQEVVDFCEKWNRNEIDKYYVYDKGNGLGFVATKRASDYKLVDIFTNVDEAEKGLKNFMALKS